jgi:hypothetical protein
VATKEQRELAKIYCSLTDLRDAMDKLRLKLVDSKSLKTRDFKSVKESRKPSEIAKFMIPDDYDGEEGESIALWLAFNMSKIAHVTEELRIQTGGL